MIRVLYREKLYFVVNTASSQITSLTRDLQKPGGGGQLAPLLAILNRFGISQKELNGVGQQITNQPGGVVPLLTGIFDFILDIIIVAVLSIYLLIDGGRVTQWLRQNMPLMQRERVHFLLGTLERIICNGSHPSPTRK